MTALLEATDCGVYCPAGDFYLDPSQPVERAVITHAHADHAYPGSGAYLTCERGAGLLRECLGPEAHIETAPYGAAVKQNGVEVSFHPAGHILGSVQVRIAWRGEVWVYSGDYKRHPDPTCEAFEVLACHTFVTESTYALPIFRWRAPEEILAEIHDWWRGNQGRGRTSIVYAYALGKAQRILAGLDPEIGPILVHGAVARYLPAYREAGVELPAVEWAEDENARAARGRALVLAPVSGGGSGWLRKFGEVSTAFVSGWMQIRGARRRRNVDRGFVLSDHADWSGLLETVRATGAENVVVMHGYDRVLARYLEEDGRTARAGLKPGAA